MKPFDEAQRFLRKAAEDEVILRKHLNDKEVSDAIWGFHAQQAAEKILKSVLAKNKIAFPKTHDLAILHQLQSKNHFDLPITLDELDQLTPFAVTFRYDDDEANTEINRHDLQQLITKIRSWAERLIQSD